MLEYARIYATVQLVYKAETIATSRIINTSV
jgi:hypothetical protein